MRHASCVEGLSSDQCPAILQRRQGQVELILPRWCAWLGQCSSSKLASRLKAPSHLAPSSPVQCCALFTPHAIAFRFLSTRSFRTA